MSLFSQNIKLKYSNPDNVIEKITIKDVKKSNINLFVPSGCRIYIPSLAGGMSYDGSTTSIKLNRKDFVSSKHEDCDVYLYRQNDDRRIVVPFFGGKYTINLSVAKGVKGTFTLVGTAYLSITDTETLINNYNKTMTIEEIEEDISESGLKDKYVFFYLESLIYNQFGNCSYLGNETNPYLLLVEAINTTIKDVIISNDTKFILDHAFSNCTNLTSVIIPNNIISIGSSAFDGCKSLKHINIPSSINILNNDTFFSCSSLESIVIPKSVTKIGKDVFRNCNQLTIFCEASSKPIGWDETWNYSNRPVYWSNQWSYVDGVSTPNN